jgi:hypothetical protein
MNASKNFSWAVACGLLLAFSGTASAADYFVFGQVFRVSTEDAEDESIPTGSLTGSPLPYPHVQVYDLGTGALLGEADAGGNGEFTVTFDLPPGSTPDVDCRVYWVLDGAARLVPAARDGINAFANIGQFTAVGLRVASDELLEYGAEGFVSTPGVGLVFTRVGKVEIPFIAQNTAPAAIAVAGLADFSSDPARAAELGVPAFRHAPFAHLLQVFGDFGLPFGPCTGDQIDWYRVTIDKLAEPTDPSTTSFLWQDPMSKIATTVTTLPTLAITHATRRIGPFDGFLDDPATPLVVDPGTALGGLYWVNRNEVGGVTNVFYSFPDLRLNWVSNAHHGLFRLSVTHYTQVGTAPGGEPILEELAGACFAPAMAPHRQLHLRVDNHGLTTSFDHIYLRNDHGTASPADDTFFAGSGNPDSPSTAGALDFNDEGLCDIMDLAGTYQVEIHFTVEHQGGYLLNYALAARSNDGASTVLFDEDDFGAHTTAANPIWSGPGATVGLQGGFARCGYDFDLTATSRQHDGYNFVQWANPERVYYVDP